MDKAVILIKIEALKRYVERIKSKTPSNKDILFTDWDTQDIIVLNLERAVQTCVDIAAHIIAELDLKLPMTMIEGFQLLYETSIISKNTATRMQKGVGFRNIAVNDYTAINWNDVLTMITQDLDDFRLYAKEIFEWLETQTSI